jgi:hypothetical protein
VRAGYQHRDRLLLALAALIGVAGLATGKDIVGRTAYELLLWNGLVFGMTVALFLGCCRTRFRYTAEAGEEVKAEPAAAELRRAA